jgi:predicted N-acetyltransferase YhbS
MSAALQIRLEKPSDRDDSLAIERLAFGEEAEAEIARAVRDEQDSFAMVAKRAEELVGHAQLSRAWVGSDPVLALGPIGVAPDAQGQGIGSALVRGALEEARRREERAVILLGSQEFYPRFGFEAATAWGLRNPFAGAAGSGFVIQEEDFMLAALDARCGSLHGPVRWHPAFGQSG